MFHAARETLRDTKGKNRPNLTMIGDCYLLFLSAKKTNKEKQEQNHIRVANEKEIVFF